MAITCAAARHMRAELMSAINKNDLFFVRISRTVVE
jgi:hypothetical protein